MAVSRRHAVVRRCSPGVCVHLRSTGSSCATSSSATSIVCAP